LETLRDKYQEGSNMAKSDIGKLNIRRMTLDDIKGVLAVSKNLGERGTISYRDMVASDVGGRRDLSFVAEAEGAIVGFIIARLEYMGVPVTEVCLMHGIVIDPEYQDHGIGIKLVQELQDYCHLEDISPIRLLLANSDQRQATFFERLGFTRSRHTIYDRNTYGN
jgi:ribosomal protein S18 acetylase RimI-like enzyme